MNVRAPGWQVGLTDAKQRWHVSELSAGFETMTVCWRERRKHWREVPVAVNRNSAGFWDVSRRPYCLHLQGRRVSSTSRGSLLASCLLGLLFDAEYESYTASHLSCLGIPELPTAREWLLAPGSCKTRPASPTQIAVVPSPVRACVLQTGDFLCSRGAGHDSVALPAYFIVPR
jgi:hypothetical protein